MLVNTHVNLKMINGTSYNAMEFLAVLEWKLQDKCEIRDGPIMLNVTHNPDRYNQTVLV